MKQRDRHSCRLKVIPVERQRTVSQSHPSWTWNLALWAHLCCALFDHDIKLIWFLTLEEQSTVTAKVSYSLHQSQLWCGSKHYQFLLRAEAAHELSWGKAKVVLKSVFSKQCWFTAKSRTTATILTLSWVFQMQTATSAVACWSTSAWLLLLPFTKEKEGTGQRQNSGTAGLLAALSNMVEHSKLVFPPRLRAWLAGTIPRFRIVKV